MRIALIALWAVLAVACTPAPEKPPVEETNPPEETAPELIVDVPEEGAQDPQGMGLERTDLTLDPLNDPASPLAERIVYFAFDSSDIDAKYYAMLDAHAQYLLDNPARVMRIEGHADERGTREYNVALGERRAKSIQRYLSLQGVSAAQMTLVSFGEELPVAFGHDEASWSMNRRVELLYEG